MITKVTSNILADNAALNNLNAGASIAFTKNVSTSGNLTVTGNTSVTGNLTVDTNTFFVDSVNNRVGIGTISPSYSLDVIGNAAFSNGIILTGTPTNLSDINYIRALNSFSTVGFLAGSGVFSSSSGPYFGARGNWYSAISNQRGMMFFSGGAVSSPTGNEGTIYFSTTIGSGTPESIRMLIGRDGNVGIGTTTPNEKLTIAGKLSASGTVTGTNLVYTTGDQTIAGSKTFSNDTIINGGLTINSTTKGLYIPRMTTLKRDALNPVADGLSIYNTTKSSNQTYNATLASWQNDVNSTSIRTIVSLTRSEYDALSSKDSETIYTITDDSINNPIIYTIYTTSVDYTITSSDAVIVVTANSPIITLPTATDKSGRVYFIKNRSSLSCTLSTTASETIDGLSSIPIPPNNSIQTISTGSNWVIL